MGKELVGCGDVMKVSNEKRKTKDERRGHEQLSTIDSYSSNYQLTRLANEEQGTLIRFSLAVQNIVSTVPSFHLFLSFGVSLSLALDHALFIRG